MSNMKPSTPSFVFGYWRPWKENSNLFDSYLDYSKDVSLAKYGADTVGKYIHQASKQQVQAINQLGQAIGRGMNVLSNQMSDINEALVFLNRNMDVQIEQQKLSNLLLQNIAELLRVPDSEKERQHSIELGIKFFVNASKDADLYADALEELLKAESLMKQDYFVLHRIGCIYLYAEKYINPEKALEYFLRAAKYASVESDSKAVRLANILTNNYNTINSENKTDEKVIGQLASDSYEKAAFAAYVLGKFEQAVDYQTKASTFNSNSQNRFLLAKYQVRNRNIVESIKNLDVAFDENPNLLSGAFKDLDLISEPEVLDLIEKKNNLINSKIQNLIEKAKVIDQPKTKKIINSSNELLNKSYELKVIQFSQLESQILNLEREIAEQSKKNIIHQNRSNDKQFKYVALLKENKDLFQNYDELLSLLTSQIDNNHSNVTLNKSAVFKEIEKAISLNKVVLEHISTVDLNSNLFKNTADIKNKLLEINKYPIQQREEQLILLTEQISQIVNNNLTKTNNSTSDKRCYIATATFGTNEHYIINDLRQFRDQRLLRYNLGRKFITFYYRFSPFISKIIAYNKCLKFLSLYLLIKPIHFLILKSTNKPTKR